ncbi:isoaspartyl peptidase/L-asparaginase, partial [Enterobacter hormaechei]|nr:isoaspartyl peptidase/L-asparaginase [Enterobacter hormaechei]
MILIANNEAWPGFARSVELLKQEAHGLDAMVAGISEVEREVKVRSVGFGGWPNMLGRMEFDAGVMDGTTRDV